MKLRWLLPAVVLCVSCAGSGEKYARIDCACPRGAVPSYQLFLQAPTGKTGCSPHALGPYREISWISIGLPEQPPAKIRYAAFQLNVLSESGVSPPTLAGGYVEIDQAKREVLVALETGTGPYWANGVYPWRPQ